MKIAVAGHSGFVGKAIVSYLKYRNHDVKLIGRPNICSSTALLQDRFGDCDWVINSAGTVRPDKKTGWAANTDLPAKLFESFIDTQIRGFLQVSSVSAVRSISMQNEIIDDRSVEMPDSEYGWSKLTGERNLLDISRLDKKICILRPPVLYGREAKGVFNLLKKSAVMGVPMPFKNLGNSRNFMFVENFAAAVMEAIKADLSGTYITIDHKPVSPAKLYDSMTMHAAKGLRTFSLGPLTRPLIKMGLGGRSTSILEDSVFSDSFFRAKTSYEPPFSFDEAIARTMNNFETLKP